MNDQMLGADPQQLRDLAKLFSTSSQQIDHAVNLLQPIVERVRWYGGDASAFKANWSSRMRPQLTDARTYLEATSKDLVGQAEQQEKASAVEGGGGPGLLQQILDQGKQVLSDLEKTAAHNAALQDQLAKMHDASKADVEAWWKSLSDADKQYLLTQNGANNIPLAEQLAELQGKLPADAMHAAQLALTDKALSTMPVYKDKEAIGIDGQVAWVHGGAHVGTEITKNADGSATLKVYGDLGGGVNTPSTKAGVGVTLTGEASRTYKFNSLADAQAAQNQMIHDLPPDDFGKIEHAVDNPGKYVLDTLNQAADKHGVVSHDDKLKGTVSVYGKTDLGGDVKGQASLDLAYEQNLTNGTSTGTGTIKADAKLDLGGGAKLEGAGEAGVTVSWDADHNIQKLSLDVKGTVQDSLKAAVNADGTPSGQSNGVSSTFKAGEQVSAKMEIYATPQNQAMINSFINHTAVGDSVAAGQDLANIYHASGVTLQGNAVVKSENNWVDIDTGVASLKAGSTSEVTTNVGTVYKAPYTSDYQSVTPADRKG
ncbi:hypothetical protein [Psychromicrobium xiongbiense]|uniref:hypothetical protein n=1 Tax=Psychromicrobium xiongbiense TaxID=3051184 RepID=UPI0025533A2D|nr:hypothetical protein [Psychromicrobium sp. YIM S02556]